MTDTMATTQAQTGKSPVRQFIKRCILYLTGLKDAPRKLNNQFERDDFVIEQLARLPAGALILDAGCGSQRYREHCGHLNYKAQDFGQYKSDLKQMIGGDVEGPDGYPYGKLDYVGNIWDIDEKSETFDAILCTSVLEHVPYPTETLREFSRLLKSGGTLILTAPGTCFRHMDPYFFFAGFSDRWFEKFLTENQLEIKELKPQGDYYSWLAVEMARTAMTHSIFAKIWLAPAFLYYYNKKKTPLSVDTMCMDYQVVAKRVAR